jgi:hypothetical protein
MEVSTLPVAYAHRQFMCRPPAFRWRCLLYRWLTHTGSLCVGLRPLDGGVYFTGGLRTPAVYVSASGLEFGNNGFNRLAHASIAGSRPQSLGAGFNPWSNGMKTLESAACRCWIWIYPEGDIQTAGAMKPIEPIRAPVLRLTLSCPRGRDSYGFRMLSQKPASGMEG